MKTIGWETSKTTEKLRREISDYSERIIQGEVPHITFNGYRQFIEKGSRKESEEEYFLVRKQLAALGLYLQWSRKEEAVRYFNELLWSTANEFTWCLAAHIGYGKDRFLEHQDQNIDLFAAETAHTLSELLVLHKEIIDPFIWNHVYKQINNRVLSPFLSQNWGWETTINNWCAVCSASVGMAALLLEEGERRQKILDKVERALVYYMKCFGEDGATEEGIGYWVYGFGYYIYYIAMRKELDSGYRLSEETEAKLKLISRFPGLVQIAEDVFLPFSDVAAGTLIPTGLLSHLTEEYHILPSVSRKITPFDFDHCYRFAHLSRNLWWTKEEIFHMGETEGTTYLQNLGWLIQKKDRCFFAVKGGHNQEQHNHNDVGSFILAVNGELFLTDLGAGPYTAAYFGEKRYEYPHTRSYWHNVPLLNKEEQKATRSSCKVRTVRTEASIAGVTMELAPLYQINELKSLERKLENNREKRYLTLTDSFQADTGISFEEGFVSTIRPVNDREGAIALKGSKGEVILTYDKDTLTAVLEEKEIKDHMGNSYMAYRVGLRRKETAEKAEITVEFHYKIY